MHWIDPDALPQTRGVIGTLIYNPHGELDGFVLDGERLVHVPPHLGARMSARAKVGAVVTLRAIKPRDADILAAVAVTLDDQVYEDDGPAGHVPRSPPTTQPVDYIGSVRLTLFAPRGEVCGALMDDGTIVRLDPHGNADLAEYFEPGRRLEVWGAAFHEHGTQVVDIDHVAYLAESEEEAQSFADGHA